MKLTKAQKEVYYGIISDIKNYDKEATLNNIIDELKYQIETELWHKDETGDGYSGLNIRVAKNLLKTLIQEQKVVKTLKNAEYKGRGGKRVGAGRPKGTTGKYKEVIKKKFTFRLSKEEEKAVRELLKKMRGH